MRSTSSTVPLLSASSTLNAISTCAKPRYTQVTRHNTPIFTHKSCPLGVHFAANADKELIEADAAGGVAVEVRKQSLRRKPRV